MTYIRVSIAHPRHGQEKRLEEVQHQIAEWVRTQPGCRASYLLKPNDGSGDVARITIYDDEQAADAAANHQHLMSLRSELNLAADPNHTERGFHAESEWT